jgi:hypothetical protein
MTRRRLTGLARMRDFQPLPRAGRRGRAQDSAGIGSVAVIVVP